jgi:outer membrane protein assembly factor BamB
VTARLPRQFRLAAVLAVLAASLAGCATVDSLNPFSSKSKQKLAELEPITASLQVHSLWQASAGKAGDYVFAPAVVDKSVYVAAADGTVARYDDGRQVWRISAGMPLSAGVASNGKIVVVGSPKGDVLTFAAEDGKPGWKARVSSEVLAAPAIAAGLVVVRSGDYRLTALDIADGKRKWLYQRETPALSLRSTATPLFADRFVFAGFPGGKLVAVQISNGAAAWEGTVALPKGSTELDRIADIVAAPVLAGRDICAVAYQGRVACFDLSSGNMTWARDVSSSAGLDIDSKHVYVVDEKGAIQAFDRSSGTSIWKQDKLAYRDLTAPKAMLGYIAVGDAKGVVHFLNRDNGAFVARFNTDGSAIDAPLRAYGSGLVVQSGGGGVFAIDTQ